MKNTPCTTYSKKEETLNEAIYSLIYDIFPYTEFQKNFLIWFNGFPDYKDVNQKYIVHNEKHKKIIKKRLYFYNQIKERVCIEILKELYPKNKYLLSTDYDDFRFGIDCIVQDINKDIIGIDITTNPKKKLTPDNCITKPLDFFRHPSISLEYKLNGIERRIYYFDHIGIHGTLRAFLLSLKDENEGFPFLENYRIFKKEDTPQEIKEQTSQGVIRVL